MRALFVAAALLLVPTAPSYAAVGVSIGINLPAYPRLVPVPGYPVYYAPSVDSNYFFYDGFYWDFNGDGWYQSRWYNGPWTFVDPLYVPLYLLQVPVRYYHHPPGWFHGWAYNEAPRWHEHWGATWYNNRHDWDHVHPEWNRGHWDRHTPMPARAPLPTYQRNYSGNRYPQDEHRQAEMHAQNYHYQSQHAEQHGAGNEHHGGNEHHDNRDHNR